MLEETKRRYLCMNVNNSNNDVTHNNANKEIETEKDKLTPSKKTTTKQQLGGAHQLQLGSTRTIYNFYLTFVTTTQNTIRAMSSDLLRIRIQEVTAAVFENTTIHKVFVAIYLEGLLFSAFKLTCFFFCNLHFMLYS